MDITMNEFAINVILLSALSFTLIIIVDLLANEYFKRKNSRPMKDNYVRKLVEHMVKYDLSPEEILDIIEQAGKLSERGIDLVGSMKQLDDVMCSFDKMKEAFSDIGNKLNQLNSK